MFNCLVFSVYGQTSGHLSVKLNGCFAKADSVVMVFQCSFPPVNYKINENISKALTVYSRGVFTLPTLILILPLQVHKTVLCIICRA